MSARCTANQSCYCAIASALCRQHRVLSLCDCLSSCTQHAHLHAVSKLLWLKSTLHTVIGYCDLQSGSAECFQHSCNDKSVCKPSVASSTGVVLPCAQLSCLAAAQAAALAAQLFIADTVHTAALRVTHLTVKSDMPLSPYLALASSARADAADATLCTLRANSTAHFLAEAYK
jgi:hypothetical protein